VLGAVDFIKSYKGDKPLCIYLPLQYPHPPYGVEDPWFSAIDRSAIPPRARHEDITAEKPLILQAIRETQNMTGWSEDRWTELRATYYGMCARLDHQFGMIIKALQQSGIYDDSAVFLFSDHGDFTGDYGLVEKTQNTMEDCLTRVPFVVKPPAGVPVKPGVRDDLVELIDFSATVYDLCGITPPYWQFGKSLRGLIAGDACMHRDAVYCEGGRLINEIQANEHQSTSAGDNSLGMYWPRIRLQVTDEKPYHSKATMCRTKTHKYVRRLYEKDELYDLVQDPQELRNCIDDPAYATVRDQMQERMLGWYQETCDVVPLESDRR